MTVLDLEPEHVEARLARVEVVVSSPALVTRTRSRRHRTKRIVLTGLFAVLITQLGFGLAAEVNPRLRDPAYADKLARLNTPTPDVLMLGSSRTLFGFHAGRLEQTTGRTAFNFGVPATGPITHLVTLDRLLNHGVRPRLLLVEVLPPMLADGPDGPLEQGFLTGERLTGREVGTVERFGFAPHTVRPAWRESVVAPWWALRFQLIARVSPSWVPWNLRHDWGRTTDARGWSTPPRREVTDAERAGYIARARSEYADTLATLQPDARPLEALVAIRERCQGHSIPLRFVLMPEAASFRAMYPAEVDARIDAALRSTGVPLIDTRHWLSETDFYDGHHPFTQGAEAFIDRLAREIER
jgi:hypothetical protein